MSFSSFPLLRLPFLALTEIFEMIELKEQFKLSLCSKRVHFAVKNYRRKSPMLLEFRGFKDYTDICLFSPKYSGYKVTFRLRAEGYIECWEAYNMEEIHFCFKERTERLFSGENTIDGTKFHVEFLCDLFDANVEEVEVYDDKTWMLDFIEERQGAFSYDAKVWDNYEYAFTDEQLRHVLLDLNPRSLDFYLIASDEFRLENFHKKYDNLYVSAGKWVTIENLFQLDCVELMIYNRKFSSTEINQYFKHVLRGGAPRLRKFRAEVQRPTENWILDGIRELLTGFERVEDELGNWNVKGTVAREEGLVVISIKSLFAYVILEIKET